MGKTEGLMVFVIIALALFLGLLLGGSLTWYMKPGTGDETVVDRTVNKYVCYDGNVKNSKNDCPVITTSSNGTQTVECPVCNTPSNDSGFVYTKCSKTQCIQDFGLVNSGPIVTTTIYIPTCDACDSDLDCGPQTTEDARCNKNKMYKFVLKPFCSEGCCKSTQERVDIRSCTSNEICNPTKGCIEREVYDEE